MGGELIDQSPALPGALLLATLACLLWLRARPPRAKLIAEALLLTAMTAALLTRGTSPLPQIGDLPPGQAGAWTRALAVVWWLISARLVASAAVLVLGHDGRARQARLFSDLLAGAIYLTAVLVILNSVLNLPVNGLLATSGVIAIVLGLALQTTLSDVFSGIAVGLEQPFRVGDRVSLGDTVEGVVVQMNWRSVRIQTDGDDLATIPNSIVAKDRILNRSVPSQRRMASVEIAVSAAAPTTDVLGVLAQAPLLCPGILAEPAWHATLIRLGQRSSTYAVSYFVATTPAMTETRSQLLRQIQRLCRYAGLNGSPAVTAQALLRDLPLLGSVDDPTLGRLLPTAVLHALAPGAVLFEQGSIGASLFVVGSGVLEIVQHADAAARPLGRIGPGEYVGEISMMTGAPRGVTVTALTACSVYELPRSALEMVLAENTALAAAIEESVHRGLTLLSRDDAARAAHRVDTAGDRLARISEFFRRAVHAAPHAARQSPRVDGAPPRGMRQGR